jgi:ribonuclease Z
MALTIQVLGQPGRDNALFVKVDTGQHITRLLFDCGDGCPHALPYRDVIEIDHLFFSHLHMDHVGGFDAFFRPNHDRTLRPNHIWGPADTAAILHHRFRGFLWNLLADAEPVSWQIHDIHPGEIRTTRFDLREAFETAHTEGSRDWNRVILEGTGVVIEAHLMNHGTPSVAYVVRESERVNVDTARLAATGFSPGPWIKRLRGPRAGPGEMVEVGGFARDLAVLQDALLITTPGESVAYLTDFRMDAAARDYLAEHLRGVDTVICESQYQAADRDLAERNWHMAADEVALMAAAAGVGRLILFHLSDRYQPDGWREILAEARSIFPNTQFPDGWAI